MEGVKFTLNPSCNMMKTTHSHAKKNAISWRQPAAPSLETARLRLRPWRREDLPFFARMNADPRVMAHYPALLDARQSLRQARAFSLLLARRGWGVWAVERRADGRFLGFCGLHERRAGTLPFAPCVELTWRLDCEHWGRGYGYEAARAVAQFARVRLKLPQLVAFTACSNARSRALLTRLGMEHAGDYAHPALPEGHPLRPHCLYRMATDERASCV